MLIRHLDAIVIFAANFTFAAGLWLLALPLLLTFLKSTARRSRFRRSVNINTADKIKKKSNVRLHIEMLLNVTINSKSDFVLYSFYFITFALFSVFFISLYSQFQNKLYVIAISIFMGALPYIALRLILNSYRIEGSYEGIDLVTQITDQYKIHNYNMREAIDKSVTFLKDCPYSLKALYRLSYAIKDAKNSDDIEQSINEFVYAFDTEWAQLLGMNMFISLIDETNVKHSLDDILKLLRSIKEQVEKSKRANNEAFMIVSLFIPGSYLLFLFLALKSFGFTYSKFFDYQFRTPMGFRMAVITFTVLILSYIIVYILHRPKYDF